MARVFGAVALLTFGGDWLALASKPGSCSKNDAADTVSLMQLRTSVSEHRTPESPQADQAFPELSENEPTYHLNHGGPWKARTLDSGVMFTEDFYGKMMPKTCRKCTSYPNVIRMMSTRKAGLLDLVTTRMTMASLAADVCAVLEERPICESMPGYLSEHMAHNVTWKTFLRTTRTSDGKEMFQTPTGKSAGVVTINTYHPSSATPLGFGAQYKAARDALAAGTPFEWNVDYDWITIPTSAKHMHKVQNSPTIALLNRYYKCKDFVMEPSSEVKALKARFDKKTGLVPGEYFAMHIRRGDSKMACDTSISGVVDYVTCSLKKGGMLDSKHPIVFFTDSQDPKYVRKLQTTLSASLGGRSVFHGDSQINDVAGKDGLAVNGGADFVFEVSLMVRMKAKAEFLMDRTHCVKCETPVATPYCTYPSMVDKSVLPLDCNFGEYAVQAQYHVSWKANAVGAFDPVEQLKANDNSTRCPSTTFAEFLPSFDQLPSSSILG